MAAPPNHLELRAPKSGLRFVALLGDAPSTPSGGIGGFEVVARPRRRPLTPWRGQSEPERWSVPILIDGWPNESVEQDIATLRTLAGADAARNQEPPELIVDGVPFGVSRRPSARWVIESIEWGAYDRRSDDVRVRQRATIVLMRPERDDTIHRLKPRRGGDVAHTILAPKGATFNKIAAKYLGSQRYGYRLAKSNGGRSPDHKFPKPRKVKLPTNAQLAEWRDAMKGAKP